MDQQIPTTQKKRDGTKWIIVVLLIIASIGTGIAYFVFSKSQTKQLVQTDHFPSAQTETGSENTVPISDLSTLQQYTNTEHGYSFTYNKTWSLAEKSDNLDFVLEYVSQIKPGRMEGEFISAATRTKSYCEQHREITDRCITLPITASSEIFIDKHNYIQTGTMDAFVVHPTQGTLKITITDANFETNTAFNLLLATVQFSNETLGIKVKVCPESWSDDKKIAYIQGIAFDAKDLDEQFVSQSCPKVTNMTQGQ